MAIASRVLVLESDDQPAAHCIVCGHDIPAGEGVTAAYQGRTYRFRCSSCLVSFELNPDRFLASPGASCCGGTHDHSPASEWSE